jgi:hypothetical protein
VPAVSGAVPSELAPSKNSTLPVAVPEPGGTTATPAVSATDSPASEGLGVLASVVVVEAGSTGAVRGDAAAEAPVARVDRGHAVRRC